MLVSVTQLIAVLGKTSGFTGNLEKMWTKKSNEPTMIQKMDKHARTNKFIWDLFFLDISSLCK